MDGDLIRIYREYRQQLFTCALAITRCPERAEDAVQEAFCRLFRSNGRAQQLKAYVFRAVRNAALDQLRRPAPNAAPVPEFIFDPHPGPREVATQGEFQRRVAAALLTLSADERETIVEHLYSGLTFREIAEVREARLGTVTTWYQRGLQKLRGMLEE